MIEHKELFVKMVLDMWTSRLNQADTLLAELSDEQLFKEVAISKNRGIYLLGHLTAIHDQMFRLLDLGNPIFPEYKNIFVDNPDKVVANIPTVNEVRQSWTNVNIQLCKAFRVMHPNEWFRRHTSVSQHDFENEPHRNKLNIVINRSSHLSYHVGQLILLKIPG